MPGPAIYRYHPAGIKGMFCLACLPFELIEIIEIVRVNDGEFSFGEFDFTEWIAEAVFSVSKEDNDAEAHNNFRNRDR